MIVDADELNRRVIEPDQFIADTEAFVDVRIPRSRGKASYSFIGPGVSQNAEQRINLTVPHGFNVGAASMPSGVVNNPHLHYTAEVFICTRGSWDMLIGRHGEQRLLLGERDVFAAPPWVFRGFVNAGDDDSWVFVVLGRDDTGGIIWSPDVLREAADTGMYLAVDNSLIDKSDGSHNGSGPPVLEPLPDDALGSLDSYSDAQLEEFVVRFDDLRWSDQALLSTASSGHGVRLAPVFGWGLSEDRRHRPPIMSPQGFSLEWIEIAPGHTTGMHRHADTQAMLLVDGRWQVTVNREAPQLARPAVGSVVSIPPNAWRDLANIGDEPALAMVICGSDAPTSIEWDDSVTAAAQRAGYSRDASGKVAPLGLLAHTFENSQHHQDPGGETP